MIKGTMLQCFHWYLPSDGSLWKQIKKDAPHFKQLGFSAIWLPPAFKATSGSYSTGYDVYDLYDLGEFDQKGTVTNKIWNKAGIPRCYCSHPGKWNAGDS